jgi:glucarate dehydratase
MNLHNKTGPKIKQVNITPIAIVDPPLLNAAGLHAPYALRTIVELITDDNIVGISEIPGTLAIDEALAETRHLIIGQDPFQTNKISDILRGYFGTDNMSERGLAPWDQRKLVHIFSAIEVACLDIVGKIVGKPIVDLLGGKRRESVPFSAYLFYKYEGAGGELAFDIDPKAQGWAAARQKVL